MKDMIRKLDNYNANSEKYKTQKTNTLPNEREFYKERKMILIAFENDVCPLPKQYPSCMDDWEGDDMNSSLFFPRTMTLALYYHNFSIKKELKQKEQKSE